MNGKTLVAYFSAGGVTADAAKRLAKAAEADLYEIRPAVPYTAADLDWRNSQSRSSLEMRDPDSRPAVAGRVTGMEAYETIFLGFPIWWYVAPTLINSFLEGYDLGGKTIIPFATSGGSGMGQTNERLAASCRGAKLLPGKLLNGKQTEQDLSLWIDSVRGELK